MEENSEEEKDNYSLLDKKRKEEIILELKKEINEQILINSKIKGEKYDDDNNNINNKNTSEISEQFTDNNNFDLNKNKKNDNYVYNDEENNKYNIDSNILFKEINNFLNDKNINTQINEEEKKENEILLLPQKEFNNPIINKQKKIDKEKEIKINNNENKTNIYLNKINNNKEILFNEKNKRKKLKGNNSFNITKKVTYKIKDINKNKTPISKAKSTEKIKYNKKSKRIINNIKISKTNRHQITSNKKSKEKFKNIQIEINNKFKEEHPFKPKINSNKNNFKNKLNETNEEKYTRLSRPKIFQIKGNHMIKTEETKLQTEDNINKLKLLNKINPKEVSNRLYKLHQQIKEKKAQVKKIFEKKELDKCSFNPEINNVSKKLVNKTYNNLSFNERNENYIKHKKENILKLRQEIDKTIEEKNPKKIFHTNNENKVYDRLYENNYYSNNININLDKSNFNENIIQRNNNKEIHSFLERQKIYEDIKKEHIKQFKSENNFKENNNKEELTFKPKINSTSDLIAKTNPDRIGEDFEDKFQRLYDEAEILKNKKEQLSEFYNAQYNFSPTINEISKLIGNNYLYNRNTISNMHTNNIILESKECTFKPKIINNDKYNSVESNYKYDENISKKIEEEMINRTNKINQLKSDYLSNKTKECKFIPQTNKNIYNLKMHYDNNDNFYQKGLKKYLEQMEKAKKAKKEKEDLEKNAFITGENWSGDKINFKPFNLSKSNNKKNVEKLREEMKNEEMKECSFQPITNETINKNIVKRILNGKNK